ncbi:hypothetical protein WS67_01120 [Burkholderia singularis]|uniref:Uncharacterized protein n=1 Tax=Burkholderia singularis TaxID=1503053 RepID=A0A103DWV5_9BURK|nr:hypothetical protein WS67_01120 [Burkholderia singularis]
MLPFGQPIERFDAQMRDLAARLYIRNQSLVAEYARDVCHRRIDGGQVQRTVFDAGDPREARQRFEFSGLCRFDGRFDGHWR